jgi:hypothetical protein
MNLLLALLGVGGGLFLTVRGARDVLGVDVALGEFSVHPPRIWQLVTLPLLCAALTLVTRHWVFMAALLPPLVIERTLALAYRHPRMTGIAFLAITALDWLGRLVIVAGAVIWLAHAAHTGRAGGSVVLTWYYATAGVVLVVCAMAVVLWLHNVQGYEVALSELPAGTVVLAGVSAYHGISLLAYPLLALAIAAFVLAVNIVVWGVFRRVATAMRRSKF